MKAYAITLITATTTIIWTLLLCYGVMIPNEVEKRMKALDLMKYDSAIDDFYFKDSVILTSGQLKYIQYGTTKNQ